jgi:hypothetical protein
MSEADPSNDALEAWRQRDAATEKRLKDIRR